jgi:hypothetical protein
MSLNEAWRVYKQWDAVPYPWADLKYVEDNFLSRPDPLRMFRDAQNVSIGILKPRDLCACRRRPDSLCVLFQIFVTLETDSSLFQLRYGGARVWNLPT